MFTAIYSEQPTPDICDVKSQVVLQEPRQGSLPLPQYRCLDALARKRATSTSGPSTRRHPLNHLKLSLPRHLLSISTGRRHVRCGL
jgi:hypothetical protein